MAKFCKVHVVTTGGEPVSCRKNNGNGRVHFFKSWSTAVDVYMFCQTAPIHYTKVYGIVVQNRLKNIQLRVSLNIFNDISCDCNLYNIEKNFPRGCLVYGLEYTFDAIVIIKCCQMSVIQAKSHFVPCINTNEIWPSYHEQLPPTFEFTRCPVVGSLGDIFDREWNK